MTQVPAGEAVVKTSAKDDTKRGVDSITKRFKNMQAGMARASRKMAIGAAAIGGPLVMAARQFMATGDKIDKFSKRTGLSVEASQSFAFAMEQSGASLEQLEPAIKGMNRNFLDFQRGSKEAKDNFASLGIEFSRFQGKDSAERFQMIIKALGGISDEGERAAVAAKMLGKSGTAVMPLIGSLDALEKEFRQMGSAMSKEQVAKAAEATDAFNKLKHQFRDVAIELGGALIPSLIKATKSVGPAIKKFADWVSQNQHLVILLGKVALGLGAVSLALKAISLVNPWVLAIGGLATLLLMLNEAVNTANKNPWLLKQMGGHQPDWDPKNPLGGKPDAPTKWKDWEDPGRANKSPFADKNLRKDKTARDKTAAQETEKRGKAFNETLKNFWRQGEDAIFRGVKNVMPSIKRGASIAANSVELAALFGQMQNVPQLAQSVAGGMGGTALGINAQLGPGSPMEELKNITEDSNQLLETIRDDIAGLRNEGV